MPVIQQLCLCRLCSRTVSTSSQASMSSSSSCTTPTPNAHTSDSTQHPHPTPTPATTLSNSPYTAPTCGTGHEACSRSPLGWGYKKGQGTLAAAATGRTLCQVYLRMSDHAMVPWTIWVQFGAVPVHPRRSSLVASRCVRRQAKDPFGFVCLPRSPASCPPRRGCLGRSICAAFLAPRASCPQHWLCTPRPTRSPWTNGFS